MNTYDCKVLADSVSPDGVRLTTVQATFPRFILAEVNTHRMLSRNSASSRAIPPEKQIERVMSEPFIPETFNRRVPGMGVGEALINEDQGKARQSWLHSRDQAAMAAERLLALDCDKSRVNRLLEPFLWHTAIISATEWSNFFALRDHPAAQPEFQILAKLMREAMEASEPIELDHGMWHLPLVSTGELAELCADRHLLTMFKMVSAGRCARVSYDTHENFETREASYRRSEMLMGNGHLSPFEHVARPATTNDMALYRHDKPSETFIGNYRGWVQFRKEIPNEHDFGLLLDTGAPVG